ncbi:hypothetical protein PLICRDRAFT_170729 [Plicaturopsis crispa FD-325 SS-3]|nr:hypothetical protein PLICRDRAFT_170729 [Plicaturopsis crispa FD-325 SS-3]
MQQESFVYEPCFDYPLHITAKRYWHPAFDPLDAECADTLTLIFLHSTSFHKETWEPTMERLFNLSLARSGPLKIKEAWALDCPNHGAAAQLNEQALQAPEFYNNFTCEKYAQSVHYFLSAGPDHGARIDFRNRHLVGIGHSLGGVAITILQHIQPALPFKSLILIESMLSPAGAKPLHPLRMALLKTAYERRDVWPSREAAHKFFTSKDRAVAWHPKVVDLYVRHALRPHPGSFYTDAPYNGVTLACTREQEATMYRDVHGPTKPVQDLNKACASLPVHIIFGAINDFLPRKVHEAVVDPASGRKFASVSRLEGVGHLVPQQIPDRLGQRLYECLLHDGKPISKL